MKFSIFALLGFAAFQASGSTTTRKDKAVPEPVPEYIGAPGDLWTKRKDRCDWDCVRFVMYPFALQAAEEAFKQALGAHNITQACMAAPNCHATMDMIMEAAIESVFKPADLKYEARTNAADKFHCDEKCLFWNIRNATSYIGAIVMIMGEKQFYSDTPIWQRWGAPEAIRLGKMIDQVNPRNAFFDTVAFRKNLRDVNYLDTPTPVKGTVLIDMLNATRITQVEAEIAQAEEEAAAAAQEAEEASRSTEKFKQKQLTPLDLLWDYDWLSRRDMSRAAFPDNNANYTNRAQKMFRNALLRAEKFGQLAPTSDARTDILEDALKRLNATITMSGRAGWSGHLVQNRLFMPANAVNYSGAEPARRWAVDTYSPHSEWDWSADGYGDMSQAFFTKAQRELKFALRATQWVMNLQRGSRGHGGSLARPHQQPWRCTFYDEYTAKGKEVGKPPVQIRGYVLEHNAGVRPWKSRARALDLVALEGVFNETTAHPIDKDSELLTFFHQYGNAKKLPLTIPLTNRTERFVEEREGLQMFAVMAEDGSLQPRRLEVAENTERLTVWTVFDAEGRRVLRRDGKWQVLRFDKETAAAALTYDLPPTPPVGKGKQG